MQQKKTEIIKCFLCIPCGPVSIDSRTATGPQTGGWGPLAYAIVSKFKFIMANIMINDSRIVGIDKRRNSAG